MQPQPYYDAALNRWEPMGPEWSHHRLEIGLDVARFGDDSSVICGQATDRSAI